MKDTIKDYLILLGMVAVLITFYLIVMAVVQILTAGWSSLF